MNTDDANTLAARLLALESAVRIIAEHVEGLSNGEPFRENAIKQGSEMVAMLRRRGEARGHTADEAASLDSVLTQLEAQFTVLFRPVEGTITPS